MDTTHSSTDPPGGQPGGVVIPCEHTPATVWFPVAAGPIVLSRRLDPVRLGAPRRLSTPRCSTVDDCVDPLVGGNVLREILDTIAATPQHRYQLVTSHPEVLRYLMSTTPLRREPQTDRGAWPPRNLRIAVRGTCRGHIGDRVQPLTETPAASGAVVVVPLPGHGLDDVGRIVHPAPDRGRIDTLILDGSHGWCDQAALQTLDAQARSLDVTTHRIRWPDFAPRATATLGDVA